MNKIMISSLLAMLILTGCDETEITITESDTDTELSENESSSNTESENDDENEDDDDHDEENDNYELHNQGVACLSCHGLSSGTVEYDERFTSGGTVYTAIDSASSYAKDYRIKLVLENTLIGVTYEIENGDGNSYTEYPEGSINGYTAQVIDSRGVVVNSSLTNSHDVTRLDCNTCHTASGTGGAPGRIVSYDYYASSQTTTDTNTTTTTTDTNTTTTTVSFASAVMPVLENNCKVCHVVGGMNEQLLITDSASTYTNIATNGYTNTSSIDSSSLLTKALGSGHGGGVILNTTDVEYQTLRDWISQGALNN